MRIVGIDPGKSGGLVLISPDEYLSTKMPVLGSEVDGAALGEWLVLADADLVVLEDVGARPKQGVVSMFTFGKSQGKVMGVLECLRIPYVLVKPTVWKARVLRGTARDKDAAIQYVRRRFPQIELIPPGHRVPQDGIADAACMAVWGLEYRTLT